MNEFDMSIQNGNGHDDVTVVYSGSGSDLTVESVLFGGHDVGPSQSQSYKIYSAALAHDEDLRLTAADFYGDQ